MFVDKALNRIKLNGMNSGEALHGNLAKCNRLKNKRLGLRIIFREVENELEVIQIVFIRKRSNNNVYNTAATRLKK